MTTGILSLGAVAVLGFLPVAAEPLSLAGTLKPRLDRGVAAISAVESPFYDEAPVRNGAFSFRATRAGPLHAHGDGP